MEDIILKLTDITKLYPGVKALDKLSMEVRRGEVHAIVGENGAGKSTLIKCLSGAIQPTSGEIELYGKTYKGMTPKISRDNGLEVIYQEMNLIESMSVAENVCLGERLSPLVNYSAICRKTQEIFDIMKVSIAPKELARNLSMAQQQLVEIAKTLSKNAKIIVMDEPTASLTESEVGKLFDLIQNLKEEGVTIIYISHWMDEIFQVSDRVTVIRDGQYICTKDIGDTNRKGLISYMVGRELSETYPTRSNITSEVALATENLSGVGVTGVTMHVNKGEIVGFAGLVGAGRTEFAKTVFGASPKLGGKIFIEGKEVDVRSTSQAIAYGLGLIPEDRKREGVFLNYGIDWNISIANIKALSKHGLMSRKKIAEQAKKYQSVLMIKTPSLDQKVMNLSGGNQQKVVLAKTLATNSDIIIFDEPTRGIDVGAKQEIYNLMTSLADEGKAIIMISSDMEELIGMSDRIYVLSEGHLSGELQKDEFSQMRILELASVEY